MQINLRNLSINTIILTTCFGLTGCAAILDFPQNAWKTTKSLSSKAGRSVASLLRPGSNPDFYNNEHERVQVMNAPRRALIVPNETGMRQLPLPTGYTQHRLPRRQVRNVWRDQNPRPQLRPGSFPDRAIIMAESEPAITELSWVKLGGPSEIRDWKACEQTAGAFAIPYQNSYRLKPEFIACMRAKNYVPESEAHRNLSKRS